MAKGRTGHMYTDDALKAAMVLDRETYKKIKHMDKVTLRNYLVSVYKRGYQAGVKSMNDVISAAAPKVAVPEAIKTEE